MFKSRLKNRSELGATLADARVDGKLAWEADVAGLTEALPAVRLWVQREFEVEMGMVTPETAGVAADDKELGSERTKQTAG